MSCEFEQKIGNLELISCKARQKLFLLLSIKKIREGKEKNAEEESCGVLLIIQLFRNFKGLVNSYSG